MRVLLVGLVGLGLAVAAPIGASPGSTHFSQDYPGAALELGNSERLGPAQLSKITLPRAKNEKDREEHDVVQMYEDRHWGFPTSESPEMQMPGDWHDDETLERMRRERRAREQRMETNLRESKADSPHLVHAEQKALASNKNAVGPAKPISKALQNSGGPSKSTSFDPATGKVIHENKAELALSKVEAVKDAATKKYEAGIKKRDAYEKGTFHMGPIEKMEQAAEKSRLAKEQTVSYAQGHSINKAKIPAMTQADVEKAYESLASPAQKKAAAAEKLDPVDDKNVAAQKAAMNGHDKAHPGKDAKSKEDAKKAIKSVSTKSSASQNNVAKQADPVDSDPLVPAKWVDPEGDKEYYAADRPGEKLYDMDKVEGPGISVVHQHQGGPTHKALKYTDHGTLKNDDPRLKWAAQTAKKETKIELSTKPKEYDIPASVKTGTGINKAGGSKSQTDAGLHVQLKKPFEQLTPAEAAKAIHKVEGKAEAQGMGPTDPGHTDERAAVDTQHLPAADQLTIAPKP